VISRVVSNLMSKISDSKGGICYGGRVLNGAFLGEADPTISDRAPSRGEHYGS
jgi:hypothetical protein